MRLAKTWAVLRAGNWALRRAAGTAAQLDWQRVGVSVVRRAAKTAGSWANPRAGCWVCGWGGWKAAWSGDKTGLQRAESLAGDWAASWAATWA